MGQRQNQSDKGGKFAREILALVVLTLLAGKAGRL
jgi:hypothetical protein